MGNNVTVDCVVTTLLSGGGEMILTVLIVTAKDERVLQRWQREDAKPIVTTIGGSGGIRIKTNGIRIETARIRSKTEGI
jgi:hypothetical protein